MRKIYIPGKYFKVVALLVYFLVSAFLTKAGTYYSNNAAPNSTANWWSNTNGSGTHPANFTTSGDIFILQTGQTCATNGNWAIGSGVTLQIDGTLSINGNNNNVTIDGVVIFTSTTSTQVTMAGAGGGNNFILSAGATLKTKNVNGIQGTNASLPVSVSKKTVTLDIAANYEFNGANQSTTGLPSTVNDLTFSGTGTKTISSSISTINGDFTTAGTASVTAINGMILNGDVVLGAGTTFNGASFTHSIKGNWTNVNNDFAAGTSTINFNGSVSQTITGSTTFKILQINNAAGIILASSPVSNITITQSLTLASGIVSTNTNSVIVGNGGSISRTNGWVNGNLQEYISASGAYNYYVGNVSTYRPVTITFSSVTTAGPLTVSQLAGPHLQLASSGLNSAKSLAPYWNLTSGGVVGTYDATFNFVAADASGMTTANFVIRNYNTPNWTTTTLATAAATSTKAIGLTTFGDFAIGETTGPPTASAPANATICDNSNATFTSNGTGTPSPIVKWQRSLNNGVTWVDITATLDGNIYTNYTTSTLAITGATTAISSYQYRSVYSNINASVNSASATLTVSSLPATPTVTAGGPITFCPGGSVTLMSSGASSYQWYIGGVVISGATSQSYSATASGSYTVIVTNGAGCFSAASAATIVTVNALPATPTVTAGGATTFCPGGSVTLTSSSGNSYQWYKGGVLISGATSSTYSANSSGSYTVVVTNAAGCYSAASAGTLVTVSALPSTPTISAGGTTTFCAGGSVTLTSSSATSYQWYKGGVLISGATSSAYSATASGTYTVIVTNAAGCFSAASAGTSVTVDATATTASIAATPLDYCATFTSGSLGGNTPIVGTGAWSQVSGPGTTTFSNITLESSTAIASVYGTYVYKWTITNGTCSSSANVTANYYATPTVATVSSNSLDVCGITSGSLGGNIPAAGTGLWMQTSGPGTTTFANPSLGTSTASASNIGTYVYTWTISNGTCSSTSASVTVNYYTAPTTALVAASPLNYCNSLTSGSLGGNTAIVGTGTWSQLSGPGTTTFSNPSLESSTASATVYGTYVYTWTITNGTCSSSANVTVNYYATPTTAAISVTPLNYCGTLTSGLLGGNAATVGTGIWSQASGPGTSTFSNPASGSSTATVTAYGSYVYTWTISNGTCASSSANATVNYYATPPTASIASSPLDYCGTLSSNSLGGNSPGAGTGAWSQTSGPGTTTFSNPASGTSTATATAYGTYVYTWTIGNGVCASTSASVTVNYYATATTASVTTSPLNNCGTLTSVSLGGNAAIIGTGLWTQTSGPGTTTFSAPSSGSSTAMASVSGSYVYKWTINNGTCSSSANVTVNYYAAPTTATVTATPLNICGVLNSGSLGGNTAMVGTGLWSQASGPGTTSFSNASSGSSTATAIVYGMYVYTWTITNGTCSSAASVTVNYYVTPSPYSVTASATSYCSNTAGVTIGLSNSQSGVNYQLYNGASTVGSPVAGTGSAISFGTQTSGTYTVIATNTATGCTQMMTGSQAVSVIAAPTVSAGAPITICASAGQGSAIANISGTVSNSPSVKWTSSGTGTFGSSTSLSTTYTPSGADKTAGSVTLTLTAFGNSPCTSAISPVLVTITPAITGNIGIQADPICSGSGYQLVASGTPTGGNGSFTYNWQYDSNCGGGNGWPFNAGTGSPFVVPSSIAGECFIAFISSGGCSVNSSDKGRLNNLAGGASNAISISGTTTICNGSSTVLSASSAVSYTYSWTSNPVGFTSNIASPTVSPIVTTIYTVIGTATSGPSCTKTSQITVNVVNPGTWLGVTSTDWNDGTNWCGGIPTPATNVIIPIVSSGNYPLISNANAVAASVNTNTGASLTMSGAYNLTLSSGAGFTNNGTFTGTASTGAVIFAGSGTVAGTVNFNNVTINGAVDFGSTGVSTVTGNLTVNSGGTAIGGATNLPTYAASSTLIYNGTATTGNEWYTGGSGTVSPGAGIPQNVTIQSGTITIPNSGGSNRALAGNLVINSGSTLQMTSGSRDIYIAGNWTNNGGFNANGRTVTFDGSGVVQTIVGTTTFFNITLQNSVFFGTSISTIANTFSNSAGTMDGGTSTVIFTGSGGSIIGSNSKYFYNLQINTGANITHTTGGGNVHIDNNYTNNDTYTEGATYTTYFDKNSGTTSLSGSGTTTFGNVTIGQSGIVGAGTTLNANAHSFTVNGKYFTFNHSNSTFNGGSSTVTFNGIVDTIRTALSVTGTVAAFYGVTVLNTTTMGIDITVNGPLSITNTANRLAINGNTLSLNGMVTGSGTIKGSSTSNITVGTSGSVGTLYFDQITGNITNVLKDFKVNLGATATVGNALNIVAGTLPGTVTANGTIISGNYLTLRSDINGTSRVAASLGSITGNVTVERYIATGPSGGLNHGKSWQLLAVPTQGQTIKNAWQEGALVATGSTLGVIPPGSNPVPGYGTMLTSDIPGAKSQPTPGFDEYTTPGPSIKYYNPVANTYVGPLNTDITPIYNQKGYFVFVRGDRSINAFNQAANPTILRTTGTLFTAANSPLPTIVPISANGFVSVGNPYASAIDFRNVGKSGNISLVFQVWDPRLGGGYNYGAFQTFVINAAGTNYQVTPGGGSYGLAGSINNLIQSGQAFFVQTANPTLPGTIGFDESAKAAGSALITSPFRNTDFEKSLRVNLYSFNTDGSTGLIDGILSNFSEANSNDLDGLDARKSTNTGENLAIKSHATLLVVERRKDVTVQDTIFLNLTGERILPYRFELIAANMNTEGLQGFLEDTFLNTRIPLNMNGTTIADFTIANMPGSYAPNRFRIVFASTSAGPLPLTFTSVKATLQGNKVNVSWQVENEMNIKNYTVEKCGDGIHFNTLEVTDATGNGGTSASYLVVDNNPVEGYNYYRVRSNDQNGKTNLTQVVKAFMGSIKHDIVVNPNPITNGIITLQFLNMPAGKYAIRMLNKLGQVIMKKQITRMDGNNTETLKWNFNLAHGMYQLEVTKPDGSVKNINVIY